MVSYYDRQAVLREEELERELDTLYRRQNLRKEELRENFVNFAGREALRRELDGEDKDFYIERVMRKYDGMVKERAYEAGFCLGRKEIRNILDGE